MRLKKILLGLSLSFCVGLACRMAKIPVPSPPVLSGALLVFMMSSGFWLVDRYLEKRSKQEASEGIK
ncbi:DUF1427 family protein [Undibacterium jejuense]|uniref:DUF1427 family protein n=1 Tax=Undibacterium jejuense TaxID=1344949 RepID=A0A923HGQ2_9BURK|nr:DUF1427 family protein [Undibacterium jejuense]MBC3863424.1 DUF1427 family protein [Undibacterium jejuense]